jgi:hypothetical protein
MSNLMCASYLTLAGSPHGDRPKFTALDRAKAAHAAGIPSIGVLLNEPLDERILRYAAVDEAEWLELKDPITAQQGAALGMLHDYYGVQRVKTGLCDTGTSRRRAAANLRSVIDIAGLFRLQVAVEPVAWGGLPLVADVMHVIREAGAARNPDVGLCFDLWQVAKQPAGHAESRDWSGHVNKIEVSGVADDAGRDLFTSAMDRPHVTESYEDVIGWVKRLRALDSLSAAPVTLELPNAAMRQLPLPDQAELAAKNMAALS